VRPCSGSRGSRHHGALCGKKRLGTHIDMQRVGAHGRSSARVAGVQKTAFCTSVLPSEFSLAPAGTKIPGQVGQATYLFAKLVAMADFLALYPLVARGDILRNRNNIAKNLGFLCGLVHGVSRARWLKELKARLGEALAFGT